MSGERGAVPDAGADVARNRALWTYYGIATAEWARQWPVEDLWAARLTRGSRS